jgi:hypothetical protein
VFSGLALAIGTVDLGWLSLLAASGSLAVLIGGTIIVTVWLTGGFHGGQESLDMLSSPAAEDEHPG